MDEYDTSSGHVELTKKMRKRDPATAPVVGDRVAFVIIRAAKVRVGVRTVAWPWSSSGQPRRVQAGRWAVAWLL